MCQPCHFFRDVRPYDAEVNRTLAAGNAGAIHLKNKAELLAYRRGILPTTTPTSPTEADLADFSNDPSSLKWQKSKHPHLERYNDNQSPTFAVYQKGIDAPRCLQIACAIDFSYTRLSGSLNRTATVPCLNSECHHRRANLAPILQCLKHTSARTASMGRSKTKR